VSRSLRDLVCLAVVAALAGAAPSAAHSPVDGPDQRAPDPRLDGPDQRAPDPRLDAPDPRLDAREQRAPDPRLDARDQRALDRMVGFLQDTQNADGGYGGQPGAASDPTFSAWVGIGLAAAGINPRDQRAPGGSDLASYVARAGPGIRDADGGWVTTEYERIGMLANVAGMDPRRFGGRDYVKPLVERQGDAPWTAPSGAAVAPGWFPHARSSQRPGVNDTIFAVIFLVGVEDRALDPVVARAADAIETMQRPDGTWPATSPGGPADVDMTGAAVQALCAARRCGSDRVRLALDRLRAQQRPDGGWASLAGPGESNTGTTPWVVQALWAAGIDPRTWRQGGHDPLDFLRSMQRRDGSVRWMASADANPTWMTAYAMPAYAGHAWPVPAPPRSEPARGERGVRDAPARRRRGERRPGRGGLTEEGDGSVVAGGGGRGAPLFSRPQPQSRGATPGGVRDTEREQQPLPAVRGDDGATGTAAAGGAGDPGGVQNARGEPAGGEGEIAGVVIGREPRGTEGRGELTAVAPGLTAASAGGTGPPWVALTVAAAALLAFAGGAARERVGAAP